MAAHTKTGQMPLPFGYDEFVLREIFARVAKRPVRLKITDNSCTVLSISDKRGALSARLHWMFLEADPEVIEEIALYIKTRKGRTPLVNEFIRRNGSLIRDKPPRKVRARTKGRHHDLRFAFDKLNREYFGGGLSCTVTWGAARPRRFVKCRTLGSYSSATRTIRINPVLDRRRVPRFFVEYVLYHEMLHAEIIAGKNETPNAPHCRSFRQRERAFKEYSRAIKWEKKNI